jgi:hypothetical protein
VSKTSKAARGAPGRVIPLVAPSNGFNGIWLYIATTFLSELSGLLPNSRNRDRHLVPCSDSKYRRASWNFFFRDEFLCQDLQAQRRNWTRLSYRVAGPILSSALMGLENVQDFRVSIVEKKKRRLSENRPARAATDREVSCAWTAATD